MKDKLKGILSIIIILLIVVEIVLSIYLLYDSAKSLTLCIVGESCGFVQNSIYGSIFGIKLGYFAIVAFVILLAMKFINKKLFLILSALGASIAIYYISIQLFVLKAICSSCIIIDSIMLVIFALALIQFFGEKNSKKK